ncbi:MAG: DNA processing protein DprA [Actinobacteria bacterium 13_2_20CM_2_71_6]|nr:MAG: DNA processing protein DprA [Actinobacteria bacterium 13_2_20CM_2_71_6]
MDERLRQRAAIVALLRLPKVSWPEIAAVVIERGDALGPLAERLDDDGALFTLDASPEALLDSAAADLARWMAEGIGVHACLDDSYPEQLRDIHQVPPVVFTRGQLATDRRAVAVVGTRQPTPQGISTAETIARHLAEAGVTVVSGLAAGIDTAAHTAALQAGGRTVAVIGTGINRSYPAGNAELQHRIAAEGLVLSQFWPDAPPTKTSFPMRNAVMSGYAAATVVVEAAYRSGARTQARLALEHGRPVVLPRQLLTHDWARDYAQRPGVHVVDDVDDLLATVEGLAEQMVPGPEALRGLAHLTTT